MGHHRGWKWSGAGTWHKLERFTPKVNKVQVLRRGMCVCHLVGILEALGHCCIFMHVYLLCVLKCGASPLIILNN